MRRYLSWQKEEGVDAVVPAAPDERAAFDAHKKARQEAKLADLRSQITGDDGPEEKKPTPAKTAKPTKSVKSATPQVEQQQEAAKAESANDGPPSFTPDFKAAQGEKKSDTADIKSPSTSAEGVSATTPLWKRHEPMHKLQRDKQEQAEARANKASSPPPVDGPPEYEPEPGDLGMEPPPEIQAGPRETTTIKKPESPEEKLEFLQKYLGDCQRCPLHKGRTNIVFGDGNARARLMFVGEGPGGEEDGRGLPFVGPSGQLLTKMIGAMGLSREEVYITNVVKCRPPDNRNPTATEIRECSPFLKKQIEVIEPEVIVTVGRFATVTLLQSDKPLGALRGKWHEHQGVAVMPTYHPAYLLRNEEDLQFKRKAWSDLKMVMERLGL